jgi:hypothetical protein
MAVDRMFCVEGRPGDSFLKLIPAIGQILVEKYFSIRYSDPANSFVVFMYNFIINIFIILIHYKISRLLFKKELWALTSTFILISMISFTVYLRHALPYDAALLILYYATWFALKRQVYDNISNRDAFIIGVLIFGAYTVYPGYYPSIFILFVIIISAGLSEKNYSTVFHRAIFYGIGLLTVLVTFEILGRIGRHSYIKEFLELSGTVTQGTFSESYLFLIKYLVYAEKITGALLLLLLLISVPYALLNVSHFKKTRISLIMYSLLFSVVLCILGYATLGVVFKKMVFYARLLHLYFPFLIIIGIYFLEEMHDKFNINYIYSAYIIILTCIAGYTVNLSDYLSIHYPKDIGYEIKKEFGLRHARRLCEYSATHEFSALRTLAKDDYYRFDERNYARDTSTIINRNDSVLVINGCWFLSPIESTKTRKFGNLENYNLIATEKSYIDFKPYQFEYLPKASRDYLKFNCIYIKIYTIK